MAFADFSPELLAKVLGDKTIKNELCTGLSGYVKNVDWEKRIKFWR
jgi:hypothetical protein